MTTRDAVIAAVLLWWLWPRPQETVDVVLHYGQAIPAPLDIAKMAGGVLPNPRGFTIADAQVAQLILDGKPVSETARARLMAKLKT